MHLGLAVVIEVDHGSAGRDCRLGFDDVAADQPEVGASSARNGRDFDALYAGIWDGRYTSQSEADLALCSMLAFWTGRDPDRIDRIFRSSGLYREKWDRDDYRDRTTGEAVAGCHETYLPSRTRGASGVTVMQEPPVIAVPRSEPADAPTRESPSPKRRLSAIPLASISMRSIEWLEKPLWQTSAFQLLAGTKGSGKGTYLAGLASRVSLTGSNVLIVSSEDSAEIDTKPRLVAAGAAIDRCEAHRRRVRRPRQRHPHRPR